MSKLELDSYCLGIQDFLKDHDAGTPYASVVKPVDKTSLIKNTEYMDGYYMMARRVWTKESK